jgi:hypothetical protein
VSWAACVAVMMMMRMMNYTVNALQAAVVLCSSHYTSRFRLWAD